MRRGVLIVAASILALAGGAPQAAQSTPSAPAGALTFLSDRDAPLDSVGTMAIDAVGAHGGSLRNVTTRAELGKGLAWSPDGKLLAFSRKNVTGAYDLWLRDARGHERLLVRRAQEPAWAPGSRRLAFVRDGRIYIVAASGRALHLLPGLLFHESEPTWSPDGRRIAFVSDRELWTLTPAGKNATRLGFCASGPSWSPRSTMLAFWSCGPTVKERNARGVYVTDLKGNHRRITSELEYPTWSPDGKWLALCSFDAIAIVHPDGSGYRRLADADLWSLCPTWAPDSRRLAFSRGDRQSIGGADIWVVTLGGHADRITEGTRYGYLDLDPMWIPQLRGKQVAPGLVSDTRADGNVLTTTRAIRELTADGSRVAYTFSGNALKCLELWDTAERSITRFPSCGDKFRTALAGDRVAFGGYGSTLGVVNYSLRTATQSRPDPHPVAGVCPPPSPSCPRRTPIGDLAGKGSLIVFDSWEGAPGSKRNTHLFRLDGEASQELTTSAGELTPLGVDADRILVATGPGMLEVLDASAHSLATVATPGYTEAVLQGRDVVLHEGPVLADYAASSGAAALHRWLVPPDSTLTDVERGVAVYVTPSAVHLLRLGDGRDTAIAPPGHGPLLAQLEPPGLFYSYVVDGGDSPGRVVFVPSAELP